MFERVQAQIAAQLDINPDLIKPESALVADLKADSLDIVALVMDLESEYNIEIPDDQLEKLVTVADIVKYLEQNAC